MADQLQFPDFICNPVSACVPTPITPPFGLPPINFGDPCCVGFDASIAELNQAIAPLYPFLRIIDCVFKVVGLVTDLVSVVTGLAKVPPDLSGLSKLASDAAALVQCAAFLGGLIPSSPLMFGQIACLIKGMTQAIIQLLICTRNAVRVNLEISTDALACQNSGDALLQQTGICLVDQGNALSTSLLNTINSYNNLLRIILLVVQITPIGAALSAAGVDVGTASISTSQPLTSTAPIDAAIVVMQAVFAAITPIAAAAGCP